MISSSISTLAIVALAGISIATATGAAHADGFTVSNSSGTYSSPPPPPPHRVPTSVAAVRG